MSWKSFACVAALSALIATPAFAVPTISVDLVRNGSGIAQLDANGDWQWELTVTTDAAGSTASELEAFFTDSDLITAAIGNATVFDTPNPTPSTLSFVTTNAVVPGGIASSGNEAVIAIGSVDVAAGDYLLATFTTVGPATLGSLSSTVSVAGNVAQLEANNAVASSYTATAYTGDINLDGVVNFTDITLFSPNFNQATTAGWKAGDFNGDGTVNFTDVTLLSPNFNTSAPGGAPATATAVPEPSSLLIVLASISGLAIVRRN